MYREIQPKDNAKLADIIRKNLEAYGLNVPGTAYFDPGLDRLSDIYLSGNDRYYLVLTDDNDEAVGGVGLAGTDLFPGCAELQKLYLIDEMKGKGLGRELVGRIEQKAAELGFERMYLETHTCLKEAVNLYESMGYESIPRPKEVIHSQMNRFFLKTVVDRTK